MRSHVPIWGLILLSVVAISLSRPLNEKDELKLMTAIKDRTKAPKPQKITNGTVKRKDGVRIYDFEYESEDNNMICNAQLMEKRTGANSLDWSCRMKMVEEDDIDLDDEADDDQYKEDGQNKESDNNLKKVAGIGFKDNADGVLGKGVYAAYGKGVDGSLGKGTSKDHKKVADVGHKKETDSSLEKGADDNLKSGPDVAHEKGTDGTDKGVEIVADVTHKIGTDGSLKKVVDDGNNNIKETDDSHKKGVYDQKEHANYSRKEGAKRIHNYARTNAYNMQAFNRRFNRRFEQAYYNRHFS